MDLEQKNKIVKERSSDGRQRKKSPRPLSRVLFQRLGHSSIWGSVRYP